MDNKSHEMEGKGRRGPRVLASAPSVVQAAGLMESAGTAWHAVKYGNLEMITKLFPTQCNVYDRGHVGENVLHTALLLNTPSTLNIARYLIKLYGKPLVNCPIQERNVEGDPAGRYEGETALHIAIVNTDFDMVKLLVQSGADIRARAWGTFFAPGGPMYYGEYPLSFAACTGQKEVVAYLRRHGARVNTDCDVFGNTALHLCVHHGQPDMYDFLVEYCAASEAVRNYAGLTPLVLAAQLGRQDMFQHILSKRRRTFYTFGPVRSYILSLREVDTVQDEVGYVPNALEVIVRKGHLDMLEEPMIALLLRHKWQAFARWQFLAHFVGYLLLEVSQTLLIWLISDPLHWNQASRASQEFLGFGLALLLALLELYDHYKWTMESYHRRLTMTKVPPYNPPLCPFAGDHHDSRTGRSSMFARLSARMSRAGLTSSSANSSPPPPPPPGSQAGSAPQPNGAKMLRFELPAHPVGAAGAGRPGSAHSRVTPIDGGSGGGGGGNGSGRSSGPYAPGAGAALAPAADAGVEGDVVSVGLPEQRVRSVRSYSDLRAAELAAAAAAAAVPAPAASDNDSGPVPGQAPAATVSHQLSGQHSGQYSGQLAGSGQAPAWTAITPAGSGEIRSLLPTVSLDMQQAFPIQAPAGASAATNPSNAMAQERQRTRTRGGGGDLPVTFARNPSRKRGDLLPEAAGQYARSTGGGVAAEGAALARTRSGAAPSEGGGGGGGGGGDEEAPAPGSSLGDDPEDPHKSPLRAFMETAYEGCMRMLEDPWLFVWHMHLLLTFTHFFTWLSTYGGVVGAPGPSAAVAVFDDIIVSLMGLSGWLAVIYFFRGAAATGMLAIILERCIVQLVRFIAFYVLWNIGFALAFLTIARGTAYVTQGPELHSSPQEDAPFGNIGLGMINLINVGLAIGTVDYMDTCDHRHDASQVFCTTYYLFYLGTTVILLLYMLIAMILNAFNKAALTAKKHWRRRWAIYVLKAERRMPRPWTQATRLGQLAWDPHAHRPLYSHVFELVNEERWQRPEAEQRQSDAQPLKLAEELVASLRKVKQ